MADISFPFKSEQSYTIPAKAVSDVVASGSGDAALLLLYLAKTPGEFDPADAMRTLSFSTARLEAAMHILQGKPAQEIPASKAPAPPPVDASRLNSRPTYTRAELAGAMADQNFAYLYQQAEKAVGHPLLQYEVSALMMMYDYLRLPANVIALLINSVVRDAERRSTPEHPVSVSFRDIKAEAVRWHENGVMSVAEAEAYMDACEKKRSAIHRAMRILGIQDRAPSPTERRYLEQFVMLDPSLELITLAYDTTVMKKGSLIWPYMRTILQNWVQKGYHSPADVEAGERTRRSAPSYRSQSSQDAPGEAYDEQVLAYIRQNEKEKE